MVGCMATYVMNSGMGERTDGQGDFFRFWRGYEKFSLIAPMPSMRYTRFFQKCGIMKAMLDCRSYWEKEERGAGDTRWRGHQIETTYDRYTNFNCFDSFTMRCDCWEIQGLTDCQSVTQQATSLRYLRCEGVAPGQTKSKWIGPLASASRVPGKATKFRPITESYDNVQKLR